MHGKAGLLPGRKSRTSAPAAVMQDLPYNHPAHLEAIPILNQSELPNMVEMEHASIKAAYQRVVLDAAAQLQGEA